LAGARWAARLGDSWPDGRALVGGRHASRSSLGGGRLGGQSNYWLSNSKRTLSPILALAGRKPVEEFNLNRQAAVLAHDRTPACRPRHDSGRKTSGGGGGAS